MTGQSVKNEKKDGSFMIEIQWPLVITNIRWILVTKGWVLGEHNQCDIFTLFIYYSLFILYNFDI